MPKKTENINASLGKLEDIVNWFDQQEDIDVEEGLKKVKAGAVLIKNLKSRLQAVENEFTEVKKDLMASE